VGTRKNTAHSITGYQRKQNKNAGNIMRSLSAFACRRRHGTETGPPEHLPAAFVLSLPTLDNLRNFFLTATTDMLSFFQKLREAP
jgi:hypothetical protein